MAHKSNAPVPGATARRRHRSASPPIRRGNATGQGERLQRLVDIGSRLHALRDSDALYALLIDATAKLSGAQRVLLLLTGPDGLRIARSLLPKDEDAEAFLRDIGAWLWEAQHTHTASLRHGPEGVDPIDQRSCVIAPMISRDELHGYLYADIEGAFGRFDDDDRDVLTMLASQAASALANIRFGAVLARKVDERTAELAVINSIQQGISRSLEFQGTVDLVGDTLRRVLNTEDIGIRWVDLKTNKIHPLYVYEHGVRKTLPARPMRAVGPGPTIARTLQPLIFNNPAELAAAGFPGLPGADPARSTAFVPVVGSAGMIAAITLENFERDNAFGESEMRLLTTIAASLGVALENARLFGETQRLLKETEQRNAELAVINSIQQGMAGSLGFRGIIELVGDKLRTVFGSDNLSIPWWDEAAGVAEILYAVEYGERVHPQPVRPDPNGRFMQTLFANRPVLANSRAEMDALGLSPPEGLAPSLATLTVPIFSGDKMLGVITLDSHDATRRFSEDDQRLLQTVAATMGIALENARLFNETQEALEQQTATAEVLEVISASVADTAPVFDKILQSCKKLFDSSQQGVVLVTPEGHVTLAAHHGTALATLREIYDGGKVPAQPYVKSIMRGRPLHYVNALESDVHWTVRSVAERLQIGPYSQVLAPMTWEGQAVGFLYVIRKPATGFSNKEIALLETFADQAVIAIQNARLFNET
ncbi:MAG: GAF domain-containing protein, partial [Betaproteobacteria bacterium]